MTEPHQIRVDVPAPVPDDPAYLHHLLYLAWGVIANAGLHHGGWSSEHPEWVEAAERWRDEWHPALAAYYDNQA